MNFRVIEDLDSQPAERFQVQHSPFGHSWTTDAKYGDQISAEIHMEKLAAGPRVISTAHNTGQ